jgi:bifunctional UDP-N-acetylglucosamine pyrophosphorylase/glucosamine-1-phosphate N-acetyltransferase
MVQRRRRDDRRRGPRRRRRHPRGARTIIETGPMSKPLNVVVLAAGKGTRMRNDRPKVLHPLAGRSLIGHVLVVAQSLRPARITVVLAPGMEPVAAEVARFGPGIEIALQEPQQGTGHALMAALPGLAADGSVLVLYGDTPLVTTPTLEALLAARRESDAAVAVLGMRPPMPDGYGRLAEDALGLAAIVEERHADPELRRAGLCNSGVMAIDASMLPELLAAIPLRPEKGEYYLTDIVELARARGRRCVALAGPWQEGVGINSQEQLVQANAILQERLRAAALANGVIMPAPETVFLAADTEIAPGAIIEPHVVIGPGVRIAADAHVHSFCHLVDAELAEGAEIGPYARLRPGSRIGRGAKLGNFVETKNATLREGAKVNHLSYVGDALVGARANVGAGTITCNYDGFGKYRTEIGGGTFIGSNTLLVAPVRVGADAFVAAGSTITRDVPDGAVAIARTPQETRPDAAEPLRARLRRRKAETAS